LSHSPRWLALFVARSQLVTPPIIMRVYRELLPTGVTDDPVGHAFSICGLITLPNAVTFAAVG